jgi:hypothetical protein
MDLSRPTKSGNNISVNITTSRTGNNGNVVGISDSLMSSSMILIKSSLSDSAILTLQLRSAYNANFIDCEGGIHIVRFLSKAGTHGASSKQHNPAFRFFKTPDTGIPKPHTDFQIISGYHYKTKPRFDNIYLDFFDKPPYNRLCFLTIW